MRLSQDEAENLGAAWATYLDSIPGRKQKAAREMVERLFPGLVAIGTTAIVFAPRVALIRKAQTVRPDRPGRGNLPHGVVPPFAAPPWPPAPRVEPVIPPTMGGAMDETPLHEQTPSAPPPDGKVKPDRRSAVDDLGGL